MRSLFLVLIIVLNFSSCKNKEDIIKDTISKNTQIFLEDQIASDGTIDTLKLITIDTLTELDEALMYSKYLSKNIRGHIDLVQKYQREQSIYKGLNQQLFNEAQSNSQKHLDSSQTLLFISQKITNKLAKYDTIKPLYLLSTFTTRIKLKNATVERDTLKITSDLKGNLVVNTEVIKRAKSKFN